MKRFSAPESALAIGAELTEVQAHVLERDLAKLAREYGRASAKVRRLKAELKAAVDSEREIRRAMRLLISVRRPVVVTELLS